MNDVPRLFVIAGMPRTGTTSLFHILGGHPEIFQPFRKEVGYFLFSHDRGPDWFRHVYERMGPRQVGLDVTPEYFFSPSAIERLAAVTPAPRIAIGVRDPGEMAPSLYREYARRRFRMPPFEEFLQEFSPRGTDAFRFSLAGGDISRRLGDWRAAFGDRLLLYDYRLLRRDPVRVLQAMERFLGLSPHFSSATFENLHLNADVRRNSRLVSHVLGRERVIAALHAVVPGAILTRLARAFYEASAAGDVPPETAPVPPIPALASDCLTVADLFAHGGLVLGSGAPFDATARSRDGLRD
jgi:hypothetical protein